MTRADDMILEFLRNEGNRRLNATPSHIELNVDYGDSTVRQRIRVLYKADLVEYYDKDRGAYRITQKGCDYLDGKLDADDLESIIDDDDS